MTCGRYVQVHFLVTVGVGFGVLLAKHAPLFLVRFPLAAVCLHSLYSQVSTPNPEHRKQKIDTRKPKPETQDPKSEIRSPSPEACNPKPPLPLFSGPHPKIPTPGIRKAIRYPKGEN